MGVGAWASATVVASIVLASSVPNTPPKPPSKLDARATRLHELLIAAGRRRPTGGEPVVVSAIEVARNLDLSVGGTREHKRRAARAVVAHLRKQGTDVLHTNDGYYLPADAHDYSAAIERTRRSGLSEITKAQCLKNSPEHTAMTGQGDLF